MNSFSNSSKQTSQLDFCSNVLDWMPEWKPAYLTTPVTASLIFLSVINLLVSPCSILLNILVIVAVKTSPRLKTNHHILLASLAGTDLLTGAIQQPLVITEEINLLKGSSVNSYSVCLLRNVSAITAVTPIIASLQHLALLSIERYLAITYPFKYLELITELRLTASVVTVWAVATLLTVRTSVYTVNNAFILNFRRVITVASISILIFCHFAVYRQARSQILKIATQQISTEARETFLKEKKALNTATMVIGVVFLSFVPIIIIRPVLKSLIGPPAWKFVLLYAFKSLVLCNSVCNPLIYCTKNKEFRQAFKRIIARQNQGNTQRKNHFDQIFKRNKTNQ